MTGPEHYRLAEKCLYSVDDDSDTAMALLATAQVHATLALAAATAVSSTGDMPIPDSDAWIAAAPAYKPPVKAVQS